VRRKKIHVRGMIYSPEGGRAEPVGETVDDGVVTIDGDTYHLEVDTGKMSRRQMAKKWERYQGVTEVILVVCTKEHRMHKLMERAAPVKDIAIFTTFDRLRHVKEPRLDCSGNSLPGPCRPVAEPVAEVVA
jgi:hypothetical protein